MLELNIDRLVPGGKEILILSLQEFTVPPREVTTGELPYLNGRVRYAQAPNALPNLTATFRDFPRANTRAILQQWFELVYNETSGLMTPMSALKTTGHVVLFEGDGTSERSGKLEGIFPTKGPEIAVNFGSGEHMLMAIEFSIDRVLWNVNLANPVQPAA